MKAIYQRLQNRGEEHKSIHVLVKNGRIERDKHGFVTPKTPYQAMTKVSIDFVRTNFEKPRKL